MTWWLRLLVAAVAPVVVAPFSGSAAAGPTSRPLVAQIRPAVGSSLGGTIVTITGTGLSGATTVRFGTVEAPWFDVVSDVEVRAEAPPGARGAVHVTVTTNGASSAESAADSFTYFLGVGWVPTDRMGYPRNSHTATSLPGGKVLVVGGKVDFLAGDDLGPSNVTLFDPSANGDFGTGSWTGAASSLARIGHTATLVGGGVLVAGGCVECSSPEARLVARAEVYSPSTDRWAEVGEMAVARRDHTATLLGNGKVLVTGGLDAAGRTLASTEVFDPTTRTWSLAHPMGASEFTGGVSVDGSVAYGSASASFTPDDEGKEIVGTNIAPGTRVQSVESPTSITLSAPATGAGSSLPFSLNAGRFGHTATALADGRVLVTGGQDQFSRPLPSAEVYNPKAPDSATAWLAIPPMANARSGHTATELPGGKVLVTGGRGTASAEVYEPIPEGGGTWRGTGPMLEGRSFHTATALPDGRVLVTGGLGPAPLATAELYDPTASTGGQLGAWGPTDPMDNARHLHTATRLADGRVLIAGGDGPGATAEIFDASPNRPPPTVTAIERSSAPTTGTEVTITGRFLRGATAVSFGGTAATSFTVISSQTIRAVSPTHVTGEVNVTVTTSAGASPPTRGSRFLYGAGAWTSASDPVQCGPTPCPARQIGTALADGRVLIIRGDGTAVVYDPETRSWAKTKPMLAARANNLIPQGTYDDASGTPGIRAPLIFSATRLDDGRVLVVGGCCGPDLGVEMDLPALSSAEIFDPKDGSWSLTGSMSEPRHGHSATLLPDGTVLITGGSDDEHIGFVSYSAEIFDPSAIDVATGLAGAWRSAGTMSNARVYTGATLLPGGQVLVSGGAGHSPKGDGCIIEQPSSREVGCREVPLATTDIYTPAAPGRPAAWSPGPEMGGARYLHTATALDEGAVLVAGGIGDPRSELYDPEGAAWSFTAGSMGQRRSRHTATLLPNGQVLVTGGFTSGSATSAELFDPASARWIATTAMAAGRFDHSATLVAADPAECRRAGERRGRQVGLSCGGVVVVGGLTPGDEPALPGRVREEAPNPTVEQYVPAPQPHQVAPDRGPSAGGTKIVLTGSGFAQASTVNFGSVAVTTTPCPATPGPDGCFTVDSPNQISALAPPHAKGAAALDVVSPGGLSSLVTPTNATPRTFTYQVSQAPSAATDLAAGAASPSEVKLTFSAPNGDGRFGPAALSFVVKQSDSPITDEARFAAADSLCEGVCRYPLDAVPAPGTPLTLVVGDLLPGTTYHYALRAVNEADMAGPISNPAKATTRGGSAGQAKAPRRSPTVSLSPSRSPSQSPSGSPSRPAAVTAAVPLSPLPTVPPPSLPTVESSEAAPNATAARLALPVAAPSSTKAKQSRPWLLLGWAGIGLLAGLGLAGASLNHRFRR